MQLPALAFADCANYTDSFYVRILDGNLQPVEGAAVNVTFDRGATFGSQYFTTPLNYTGPDGILHYTIYNQGTSTRQIDCTITISANSSGEVQVVKVQANQHGSTVDVPFADIFPLRFYVRDQFKGPIEGAGVSVFNKTLTTDSNGMVKYFLQTGSYGYFANYKEAQASGTLNVSNDTEYEVIFPYYKVRVEADDDNGQPLNASLNLFNETFPMPNGVFQSDKIFGESIPYTVDYKGVDQAGTIEPATNPQVTVYFDLHSPVFGQITPTFTNGRTRLMISASDPGEFASGLNVSSIKTSYKLEPSDATSPWSSAVTFTAGRNQFESDFPQLPPNSIVDFKIEIEDMSGNKAEIDGKFTTFSESNPQNNTQNQTNTQPQPPQQQGIPLSYIVVGGIVVVLVIFVVFRMKSKAGGGA